MKQLHLLLLFLIFTSSSFSQSTEQTPFNDESTHHVSITAISGSGTLLTTKQRVNAQSDGTLQTTTEGRESSTAWAANIAELVWYTIDVEDLSTTTISSVGFTTFCGDFLPDDATTMYAIDYNTDHLIAIDVSTGSSTNIASVTCPLSGGIFTGMATDKSTGTVYVSWTDLSKSGIGTLDITSGVLTQIGSYTTIAPAIIEIAIDGTGQMYGWDVVTDKSYTIDKTTGEFSELGLLGYNANYAQGGNWDPVNDNIYICAYGDDISSQLRILNRDTGGTSIVGSLPNETGAFGFPGTSQQSEPDIEVSPESITIYQRKSKKPVPAYRQPLGTLQDLRAYIGDSVIDEDGSIIYGVFTPGIPPDGHHEPVAIPGRDAVLLPDVPAFNWSFGCGCTSAAMMAGYYDNHGFGNVYTGPTNGGVCPMDNSEWPDVVINGATLHQCPLSATRLGLDGRTTRGNVDDYWIEYENLDPDPWITNGWVEHTWDDCTADFMGISQSTYNTPDGQVWFWYRQDGEPNYDFTGFEPDKIDGCHGMREFFESRGYTVATNYSQNIYGYDGIMNGFTLEDFHEEIDAGRPVVVLVSGHVMLGVGYEEGSDLIYIHDTWDYDLHSMTWGGEYSGMYHYGVSVVELEGMEPPGDYFTINNTGEGILSVTSLDGDANWLLTSGFPSTPFNINPGEGQSVNVGVDWELLGDTQQTGQVTINSNDPDEPTVNVEVTAIPGSLPDLTFQSHSVDPSTVGAGGTVNASCVITNQGNNNAINSLLKFYLSTDESLDTGDICLDDTEVPALAPDNSSTQNMTLTIPLETEEGTYYLIFCADADDNVSESDENNNVSAAALTVSGEVATIMLNILYDSVPASAGFVNIDVTSNISWVVFEDCEWIACNPTSGENNGSFTIVYQNNNTDFLRSCAVIVSGGGASAGLVIYQEINTSVPENNLRENIIAQPNPFSSSVTLEYELKHPEKVWLTIFNHLGEQVYHAEEKQVPGKQQLLWNAEGYADGVYYYRLRVGDAVANGKMVKVK